MKQTIREWWGDNIRWWLKYQRWRRSERREYRNEYREDFKAWKNRIRTLHKLKIKLRKEHENAGRSVLETTKPQSNR